MLNKYLSNLKSGVTVALVSIPLSVSLAIASGVSPSMGIITAIWAGLIGAIFGGSNYNIIGPTGALSGFIAAYVLTNGIEAVPCLALLVGFFIIVAYLLKLEKYLVLIPSSVIHGFTLGVACIIILSQMNNIFPNYILNSTELWFSIATFAASLTLLILLKSLKFPVPGVIIIVPVGILLGWASANGIVHYELATLGIKYGAITPQFFNFSLKFVNPPIIQALVISIVAILETLLSAKIADSMTHTSHNSRKEVLGLGLANIASGFVGGMPATAALARTALNIRSGAVNRYSGAINSIVMIAFTALFISYFYYIPTTIIAAILVYTAINMIEQEHFVRLYTYDKISFFIAMLVAIVTIFEDPIFGILVGTVIALLILINNLIPGQYRKLVVDGVLIYSIKGEFVYLNGDAQSARFLRASKEYGKIVLDLGDINFIDLDAVDTFDKMIRRARKHGKHLIIANVPDNINSLLHRTSEEFRKLQVAGLIFDNLETALKYY